MKRGWDSAFDRVRRLTERSNELRSERVLDLSVLEDRVLLSAAPVAAAAPSPQAVDVASVDSPALTVEVAGPAPSDLDAVMLTLVDSASFSEVDVSSAGSVLEIESDGSACAAETDSLTEVAFVDSGAADFQKLVDDLNAQREAGRNIDVFVLDAERDGIEQITSVLANYRDVDAVHVVSHATDRGVKLGSTWLTNDSLAGNAGAIANWGWALSSDADLLFYGCDLASTESGRELLESIGALTGADVAASVDDTGDALLGGDWELEFRSGDVAATELFSSELRVDWHGLLNTFVVTTTANSGAGSLRQAILDANALAGLDTITFNLALSDPNHMYYRNDGIANSLTLVATTTLADAAIADFDPDFPGTPHSWWTIKPTSALPAITERVILDATSQPGWAGTPVIELDGSIAGGGADGLIISGSNSTIRGLVINRFNGNGIAITGDNNVVEGSYIGLGVDGVTDRGNNQLGIAIDDGTGNRIGGTGAGAGNVISGNGFSGMAVRGSGASGNVVIGNLIGTDATGTVAVGNDNYGIDIWNSGPDNNTIGGVTAAERNVISGNAWAGIHISGSGTTGNVVLGNYIGTDVTSTAALGNGAGGNSGGIAIDNSATDNVIGGTAAGEGNLIAYNTGPGVRVEGSSPRNAIRGNSIYGNTGLGIDLENDGVTPNDLGDGDGGANAQHNYPVLTGATVSGGNLTVTGTLNTIALLADTLDFYWSPAGDPSNHGEAQTYIGSKSVFADFLGNSSFNVTFTGAGVPAGAIITATATDAFGDTSEFSLNRVATLVNTAPIITSNGGGVSASVSIAENTTVATTVIATDADLPAQTLTYSISGGADSAKFTINSSTGVLSFAAAPNYEAPTDAGANNVYDVTVQVSDGSLTDTQAIVVTVLPVNDNAPVITSNGGGAWAFVNVGENTTAVTAVTATDADLPAQTLTYSISGGADAAKFTINSSTGALSFVAAPNYEAPTDAGANNVYDVTVLVSDGTLTDTQAIAVTVTNQAITSLTTTGSATVSAGAIYTLNLAADEDTSSWTINWGDGSITTHAGNPASVTHIYSQVGFTFNILASATDASGTIHQNQLLVPTYTGGDSVFRFAATTGAFLEEFATGNGLNDAIQAIIGPDGNLYVSGEASSNVLRYDPQTSAFIDAFVPTGRGGLNEAGGIAFGPDGNLYVASYAGKQILRYDGTSGAFIDVFSSTGTGSPYSLTFGPDGNLYVGMYSSHEIRRYNGSTGALIGTFVTPGSGGLNMPEQIVFGPDGHLYVASYGTDAVLRYNGATGAFLNAFVTSGSGGLDRPTGLAFGPDGNLYVTGESTNNVLRYSGTTGAFLDEYVAAGSGGLATPTLLTFLPEQQVRIVNTAPTITSNGGGASASFSIAENTTAVTTVTATDADVPGQTLTYSISGGADAAKFTINSSTGVLSFAAAPNYEVPTDAGVNNVYDVTVQVSDGIVADTQAIAVTVTPVNDNSPVITSNGGGASATADVNSNTTAVTTVTATDADLPSQTLTYSISGGADAARFAINSSTGALSFLSVPSYGAPTDTGANNIYDVTVQVSDGSLTDTQAIAVRVVADVAVNSVTANIQTKADVATDATGNYVVVWASQSQDGSGWGIFGRRFDANGIAPSGEFQINTTSIGDQFDPAVAMDDAGNFVVTWTSLGQGGDVAGDGNIYARRYNAAGVAQGLEFLVNTTTAGDQREAAVACADDDGHFLVVWASNGQDGSGWGVYAQEFDGSGNVVDAQFRVNATTAGDQRAPDVGGDVWGEWAVTWQSLGQDGDGWGIYSQMYRDSGNLLGPERRLNQTTAGNQYAPAVMMEDDGDYVVTWVSDGQDGSGSAVVAAYVLFGGGANNVKPEFIVNSTFAGDQSAPDIASQPNGNLVITWMSTGQDGDGPTDTNLYGRVFEAHNGGPLPAGNEFLINAVTIGSQQSPAVAADDQGDFVVAWNGQGLNEVDGIYSRIFMNLLASFAPSVSLAKTPITFTENGAAVVIDSTLSVTDSDSANLTGATISIIDGFAAGQDQLLFTNQRGITGSYDPATGVLTLTGTTTLANYQTALRTVTYRNTSEAPSTATRTLEVEVTDGTSPGNDRRTLNVVSVNDPPVATNDSATTAEDVPVTTGNVLLNDTDVDGGPLTITSFTQAANGTVVNNFDGTFTYTPNVNFNGSDSFTYTVSDGLGGTAMATVNLAVTAVNDTPIITSNGGGASATISINENTTAVTTVTATDPDAGTTLTFSISGGADAAKFSINGLSGVLTFVTAPNFEAPTDVGTDNVYDVVVQVSDGTLTDTQSLAVTVTNVNEAPTIDVAGTSLTYVEQAVPLTIDSGLTVSDDSGILTGATVTISGGLLPGADELLFTLTGGIGGSFDPATGTLTLAGSASVADFQTVLRSVQFRNLSDAPFVSIRTITFAVTDGLISVSDARDLSVSAINDPPTIDVDGADLTFVENDPALVIDADLTVSDVDGLQLTGATVRISGNFMPGEDVLSFSPAAPISGSYDAATGILTLTGNGTPAEYQAVLRTVAYRNTSDSPNTSPRTITIEIDDGLATASDFRRVLVIAVNDAPTMNSPTFSLAENSANGTVVGTVTATDPDAGDTQTFAIIGGNTGGGFAINASTGEITVVNSAALDYDVNPTFALSVEVTDGSGLRDSDTVTINLTNVNEAPTMNSATFSLSENSANGTVVGTATATDPDAGDTRTFAITGGNVGGAFSINAATGVITVAESDELNFETTPSFVLTVRVTDAGGLQDSDTVTINLTDANEQPAITSNGGGNSANISLAENTSFVTTVTATDPDAGSTLTYSISGGGDAAKFTIDSSTGVLSFIAAPNFEAPTDDGGNNVYLVNVRVSDGVLTDTQNLAVTVTNVNEVPTMNSATFSVLETAPNGAVVGTATATDPDAGDSRTFAITGGNVGGAFAINAATGTITVADSGVLEFDVNPTFQLSVQVTDGGGLADTNTITINLTNVNVAPVVIPANFSLAENSANGTVVGVVSATDSDAGDSWTFSIVGGNVGGAFAIQATTGQIIVINAAAVNFETTPVFHLAVRATDSGGLFDTEDVRINLSNVNEAPNLNDVTRGISENAPLGLVVIDLFAFDPDAGDTQTFAILGGNIDGGFAIDAATGRIVVADPTQLDSALKPTYSLVIQVSDSLGLSDTATVTIDVGSSQIIAPAPPSGSSGTGNNSGSEGNGSTTTAPISSNNKSDDLAVIIAPPPASTSQGANGNGSQNGGSSGANIIPTVEAVSNSDTQDGRGMLLVTGESLIKKTADERQSESRSGNPSRSQHSGNGADTETNAAEKSLRDSLRFGNEDLGFLVDQQYLAELKLREEKLDDNPITPVWVTSGAAATTAGLSIGYILWLLRSGYLVTSILATLPMWQSVDPLPILGQLADDEDDESLNEMIERSEAEMKSEPQSAKPEFNT